MRHHSQKNGINLSCYVSVVFRPMWPQDGNAPGQDAQYPSNDRNFTVKTIGVDTVVEDSLTGLIWQQSFIQGKDWQGAVDFCDNLVFAGEEDWRLPDYHELLSIIDFSKFYPATDLDYFPSLEVMSIWTSSAKVDDYSEAWSMHTAHGVAQTWLKTGEKSARCVRTGSTRKALRRQSDRYYIAGVTGEEVVLDRATGLEWQLTVEKDLPWKESLKHCEEITYGGLDDWRLPNIAELRSLVDIGVSSGAVSEFPEMPAWRFKSSTTSVFLANHGERFGIFFTSGEQILFSDDDSDSGTAIKCVRSGP